MAGKKNMKVELELPGNTIDDIVRQDLMQVYSFSKIEEATDTEFLYCLQRVIEYYSSATQYEAWQESLSD